MTAVSAKESAAGPGPGSLDEVEVDVEVEGLESAQDRCEAGSLRLDVFLQSARALNLEDTIRWLAVNLSNETGQKMIFDRQYFQTGRWWREHPSPVIDSGTNITFAVCATGTYFCGVSMFVVYRIGRSGEFLGIAMSSPYIGHMAVKCAISKSRATIGQHLWKTMTNEPGQFSGKQWAVTWHRRNRKVVIDVAAV